MLLNCYEQALTENVCSEYQLYGKTGQYGGDQVSLETFSGNNKYRLYSKYQEEVTMCQNTNIPNTYIGCGNRQEKLTTLLGDVIAQAG